jgi:hypothetical protein
MESQAVAANEASCCGDLMHATCSNSFKVGVDVLFSCYCMQPLVGLQLHTGLPWLPQGNRHVNSMPTECLINALQAAALDIAGSDAQAVREHLVELLGRKGLALNIGEACDLIDMFLRLGDPPSTWQRNMFTSPTAWVDAGLIEALATFAGAFTSQSATIARLAQPAAARMHRWSHGTQPCWPQRRWPARCCAACCQAWDQQPSVPVPYFVATEEVACSLLHCLLPSMGPAA